MMKRTIQSRIGSFSLLLTALFFVTCQQSSEKDYQSEKSPKKETLFSLIKSDSSGIDFKNTITSTYDFNILEYNYFYNGSGVAVGDINNDGWDDVFFGGNMVSSRLYLNQGKLKFEDITEKAGVTTDHWITGVSMIDINQDGWLDIYLCASGYPDENKRHNLLFINQQNGTFKEMAADYGLDDNGYSTQAAWLDYDRDGDLDLYLLTHFHDKNNPNIPRPKDRITNQESFDRLYRNDGNDGMTQPTFTEVSKESGIGHEGYGLGIAIEDFNRDSWPDIYVANDFVFDDLLYINQQDGTFKESAAQFFNHTSRFSMGTDAADINNDDWPDLITLDMLPDDNKRQKLMNIAMNYDRYLLSLQRGYLPQYSRNTLQLNNGTTDSKQIPFSEIGQLAEIYETDWSWSALFADYDNDGLKDLYITNGIPKDITDSDFIMYRDSQVYKGDYNYDSLKKTLLKKVDALAGVDKSNFIFKNNGDLTFSNKTTNWGLTHPSYSNGAAYADLDQDGDLDLLVNNIDAQAFLFRNESSQQAKNNFLQIKFNGPPQNQTGIGTRVEIIHNDQKQTYYHQPYRGFQSSVVHYVHAGLGKNAMADSIVITWPDRKKQVLQKVAANQTIEVNYSEASKADNASGKMEPLFAEVTQQLKLTHKHQENPFADFKFEPLLPHKFSQNGPGLAVGDVNGDGLEDFWMGGSHLQPGTIFIQRADGTFSSQSMPDEKFEDMGALLFDFDNDNDLDLYVVSGGSEFNANTATYQDRLYRNNGKGAFTRDDQAIPNIFSSGSCVNAADYDQDGDLDLFIGGRVTPARYPQPAFSYILRNEGGKRFADVTNEVCPEVYDIGLVTAALWSDFNTDNQVDLIVVGEWLPLTFFKNENGKLVNISNEAGLQNSNGWWNSITGADFDQDGDIDYVAGNLGLNSPFKASTSNPVTLVANDYDQNGSIDAILSRYHRGLQVPFAARDALIDQMTVMRKRFPTYASYAEASLNEVLTSEEMSRSYQLEAKMLASCYIENTGNEKFIIKPLPNFAQISPLFGLQTGDFNQDGYLDVVAIGNSYATEFVTGQYDALKGLLLLGDDKGNFYPSKPAESGFIIPGDGKALVQIKTNQPNQRIIIGAQNNGPLRAYAYATTGKYYEPAREDASAMVTFADGKKHKYEFYHGSGYLSQHSRKISFPQQVKKIRIVKFDGSESFLIKD